MLVERKVETVAAATFLPKSKVAICWPVPAVMAVGTVFDPVHAVLAAKNAFLIEVSAVCA